MIAIGPPTLSVPAVEVRRSICPGTALARLLGGVRPMPAGYICASRVSCVTFGTTCGYVASYGTEFECMCLNASTQAKGSRKLSLATSAPGVELRETTPTQFTGLAFGIIFLPPLIAFGSLYMRVTSAWNWSQASGDA